MKLLPAAALLACLLAAGTAAAREHHTDGRAYLKRANKLAGEGNCAAAVKDYTKAYEKLNDPIVLFNRAECYRRLGESAKAIDDYRGFLKGFPAAPNRADIEAKISTLAAALQKPVASPAPARPPPGTARATPPPPPVAVRPPPSPPPVAAAPPPPAATAPVAPAPMPFLPPPPPAGEGGVLIESTPAAAPGSTPKDTPKTEEQGSRWWLWTALAVVAVGGGVAGYMYLRPKDEPLPMTSLGNYRF